MTRLQLIHELHAESPAADRCPHLEHDQAGCRCRRVAEGFAAELPTEEADQTGTQVCDHFSLRLWCLAGPARWKACAFFG